MLQLILPPRLISAPGIFTAGSLPWPPATADVVEEEQEADAGEAAAATAVGVEP
eukprot:COSAG06_NODE_2143_length_7484_cov_6.113067_1_plen_53_part_10